ncbi:MAG: hypothetical protein NW217_11910 [Hyphomicrobiaceae bacterium]|nr:hypothetical protein [Hyphomicrobiaceae bacterium]
MTSGPGGGGIDDRGWQRLVMPAHGVAIIGRRATMFALIYR